MFDDGGGFFDMLLFYLVLGAITWIGMMAGGAVSESAPWPEVASIILFWPLFVIKYLVIGIWMIMSAGWGLMI